MVHLQLRFTIFYGRYRYLFIIIYTCLISFHFLSLLCRGMVCLWYYFYSTYKVVINLAGRKVRTVPRYFVLGAFGWVVFEPLVKSSGEFDFNIVCSWSSHSFRARCCLPAGFGTGRPVRLSLRHSCCV